MNSKTGSKCPWLVRPDHAHGQNGLEFPEVLSQFILLCHFWLFWGHAVACPQTRSSILWHFRSSLRVWSRVVGRADLIHDVHDSRKMGVCFATTRPLALTIHCKCLKLKHTLLIKKWARGVGHRSPTTRPQSSILPCNACYNRWAATSTTWTPRPHGHVDTWSQSMDAKDVMLSRARQQISSQADSTYPRAVCWHALKHGVACAGGPTFNDRYVTMAWQAGDGACQRRGACRLEVGYPLHILTASQRTVKL